MGKKFEFFFILLDINFFLAYTAIHEYSISFAVLTLLILHATMDYFIIYLTLFWTVVRFPAFHANKFGRFPASRFRAQMILILRLPRNLKKWKYTTLKNNFETKLHKSYLEAGSLF